MATLITPAARRLLMLDGLRELRVVRNMVIEMRNMEEELLRQDVDSATIESNMNAIATEINDYLTQIGTNLDAINTTYSSQLWAGYQFGYANIDAVYDTTKSRVTLCDQKDGTVSDFGETTAFIVGDTVTVSNCEDSDNDGDYVIDSFMQVNIANDTVVFTTNMSDDNTEDTGIKMRVTGR